MFHPPSRNWLSPQGNSSSFIVKKTMRMDIPVDKYPNVRCQLLSLSYFPYFTSDEIFMIVALFFAVQLCGSTTWSKRKFP